MSDAVSLGSMIRLAVSLGMIVGVLLLVRRWALRGNATTRSILRVVARVPLGRSSSVALLEMGDQQYLVGIGEQGVTLIDRLDGPPAAPSPTPVGAEATDRAAAVNPQIVTDDTWPRTGLVDRARRMTLRAPGRARGDTFDI